MAAPSFVGKGNSAGNGTGTSISGSLGTSQANDIEFLLVISHQPNGIGVINAPSTQGDWTEIAQGTYKNSSSTDQGRVALFWRRTSGNDSGNTWTIGRTGDTGTDSCFFGHSYTWRGCATSGNPYDAVTARYGPGNATVTWDAVTVSGAQRTLAAFCAQGDNAATVDPPSGYTGVATDTTNSGTDGEVRLSYLADVSSDGSVTATGGETIGWGTFFVSLKPTSQALTLTADVGTFNETGIAATLTKQLHMAAAVASFIETGNAANLIFGHTMQAEPGTFALTGQDAAFRKALTMAAATGAFGETGIAAGLYIGHYMAAAVGAFIETGNDAAMLKALHLAAEPGAFTLTGQDAALVKALHMLAATGDFIETGNAAALTKALHLVADTGSFLLTGFDANLVYTPAGTIAYTMQADPGVFTLTGVNAALQYTPKRKIAFGWWETDKPKRKRKLRPQAERVPLESTVPFEPVPVDLNIQVSESAPVPQAYTMVMGTGRFQVRGGAASFRRGYHMRTRTGRFGPVGDDELAIIQIALGALDE